MKKIYETPMTAVVAVSTDVMILAGSVGVPNAVIDDTEQVNASELESRRSFSVWDDDEE